MRLIVVLFVCSTVTSCTGVDQAVPRNANNRLKREVSTCTNGYENVQPTSTMCLEDSELYVAGTAGVSDADKATIITAHNDYRAGVKDPTAKNMMKVYWDDKLAAIADKWARQCKQGHEKDFGYSRVIPDYFAGSGQNGAFGDSDWTEAIARWYNEVNGFTYGQTGQSGVGHYTQVVRDTSILVGCGYAECNTDYKRYYFCNYLTGQMDQHTPYQSGPSCGDCQDKCSDGKLCDCGKKFCFNFATMDINTCTCTCSGPHWSGSQCLALDCEILDPGYCTNATFCNSYANWPSTCPHLCGIC